LSIESKPSLAQASILPLHFKQVPISDIVSYLATLNRRTFWHFKQHNTALSFSKRNFSRSLTAALSQFGNSKSLLDLRDKPIGPGAAISIDITPS
jgi:hypothetical protein